jgi:hypothetical protein
LVVRNSAAREPLLKTAPLVQGRWVAARMVTIISGVFVALAPMSALGEESLQEKPIMTKHTIGVEHIRIESKKSFADVRAALERDVPQLDPTPVKALANGDVERANREKEQGQNCQFSRSGIMGHCSRSQANRVMRSNTKLAIL